MLRLMVLGLIALLLAACGSVPMAPPEADAAGKQFAPPSPGLGALYIARRPTPIGSPVSVTVGPNSVGSMVGGTWLRLDLPPGRYDVRHKSEENSSSVMVDLAAGQTVFVEMAWQGFTFYRMRIVSQEVGRELVLAGHRAQEIR